MSFVRHWRWIRGSVIILSAMILAVSSSGSVLAQSIEDYRSSAEQGDAEAQFALGMLYYDRKITSDVIVSDELALHWLEKAAEQGHVQSYYQIGMLYLHLRVHDEEHLPANHETMAYMWFAEGSTKGLADAQYQLGLFYINGSVVEKDAEMGIQLLRLAAEQGHIDSMLFLGFAYGSGLYASGQEGQYDPQLAGHWYGQASNLGNAQASYELAKLFESGEMKVDNSDEYSAEESTFIAYAKAAQLGHTEAQFNLAEYYSAGRGIDVDLTAAAHWYRKAADQQHTDAEYAVGVFYENGLGVERNYYMAFDFYQRSAEAGHREAQNNLGSFYNNGWGITQNIDEAERLFRLSAAQGNQIAQENLDGLLQYKREQAASGGQDVESPDLATAAVVLLGAMAIAAALSDDNDSSSGNEGTEVQIAEENLERAQCRAEAAKHITQCAQVTDYDSCTMTGCDEEVICERRAWCVSYGSGPYGRSGEFYCDIKHRRNMDFDYETVLTNACNGKY